MQARRRFGLINTIIGEEEDSGIRLSKKIPELLCSGKLIHGIKILFS
jgi:hypothetical protein